MSSYNERNSENARPEDSWESSAAEAVRRAFAALPMQQRVATLIQVEVDLVSDAAEAVLSAASDALDRLAAAIAPDRKESQPAQE